jgi:arylsulfatase A
MRSMSDRWNGLGWILAWLGLFLGFPGLQAAVERPPNVVVIFCDDLGWGDLGCYGARGFRTPHLDRLAREGTRFTSFYVAQPVCSASRAALLTGCYPNRIGIHGALFPNQKLGLHPEETTLAEILRDQGYATGMVGKWHLGRPRPFLPMRQGFQSYFGLPYSNDMRPNHPAVLKSSYPPLPLIEGDEVLEENPDQRQLTGRYTEKAVQFIEAHRSQPFFLYLAHSMPHVPLFASDRFAGRTPGGLYGDVIEELDDSVGKVLDALRRHRLEENTWVIFTSDNGPWLSYGDHGGSAGPFREGKGTVFEGGVRVPCLMRWPGKIPAGRVSAEPAMTIDILPTVAGRVGARLPSRTIDGLDLWPVFAGTPGAKNPHAAYYFYYNQGELQALRSGPWKLHFPHLSQTLAAGPRGSQGKSSPYRSERLGLELYHLEKDAGETRNVAAEHPEVVRNLIGYAESARQELGDRLTGRVGSGVRPAGEVP